MQKHAVRLTSAFQNRNSPRLSAWAAGFEPLHIEII